MGRAHRGRPHLYGVVLNPASGPGRAPDPAFAEVAAELRRAGVRVLGYTDTDYARRPHAEVVADLLRHQEWYGADGAFLDQVATEHHRLPHYRRLALAARAAGARTLVLNHGTAPHPEYAELADVLVTFEGTWETYTRQRPPGTRPGTLLCHLVYDAPADALVTADLHCAVPGAGAHPWGTLPHALRTVAR